MVVRTAITVFLLCLVIFGPSQIQQRSLLWTGLANEWHFKKTSTFLEVEYSQSLPSFKRDYFTVLINTDYTIKKLKPGLGFSYWLIYSPGGLIIPEWRPHIQEEWSIERSKFTFFQRLRFENRIIGDTIQNETVGSFRYVLRPRLVFQMSYYLLKKKGEKGSLQVVMSEELLANIFSKTNGFSENRAYTGVWYALTKTTSLRLGYMWIYGRETWTPSSDIIYFTLKNDF